MKHLAFYVPLHYPDRGRFFEILQLLDEEGAGYVEVGIPVSDPYMDGEIIRESNREILKQNLTGKDIAVSLKEIRSRFHFKVVIMTYQEGVERFGLTDIPNELYDGFICVNGDYPPDMLHDPIYVLSQSKNNDELKQALEHNHLFAYVVSGEGKTGSFDKLPDQYIEVVKRVKTLTSIPAFVGFGIKSAADVKTVMKNGADGAIIGTEFIRRYKQGGFEALKSYIGELKTEY
jgi:tryptophan synthase alpha chain